MWGQGGQLWTGIRVEVMMAAGQGSSSGGGEEGLDLGSVWKVTRTQFPHGMVVRLREREGSR